PFDAGRLHRLLLALSRHRNRVLHLAQARLGAGARRQAEPGRRLAPQRRGLRARVRRALRRAGSGPQVIVLAADFLKSATAPEGYPEAGPPEFAFCGRSNVGKSSALNALAGRRQLARVSRTPGRTRLINFFDLRVRTEDDKEHTVRFADLPGYGFASGPKDERAQWKAMIERYLGERERLAACVGL